MCSILKRSLIRKTFVSLHLKNCMSLPATSLQYSSSSTILKLSKKEFKLRRLHCSNTLFAHASQRSFLLLNESSWGTKYLHTMNIMFTKSDENDGLPERQRLKESSKQSMCTEDALSVSTDEVDTDTRVEMSGDDPVSSLSSEKWSDYFDDYNFEDLLQNIHKKQAKREEEELRKAKKRGVADLMSIEELVEFLKLENAQDVCVIHVSPDKQYVDYLVTCTGVSTRHIKRMADALATEMRQVKTIQKYSVGVDHRRVTVEGRDSEDWMAVDIGNIVVHFMMMEAREKYQLEKLWSLGGKYDDFIQDMIKIQKLIEAKC